MTSKLRPLALLTLFAACISLPAQAQPAPNHLPETPLAPVALEISTMPVGEIHGLALTGLPAAWWEDLGDAYRTALTSPDAATRAQAMQHIIYFANQYPAEADFDGAAAILLETYILDRDEAHRILALAALSTLGNEAAMRHVAQYVKLERSARVRKLTQAALVDYFGNTAG